MKKFFTIFTVVVAVVLSTVSTTMAQSANTNNQEEATSTVVEENTDQNAATIQPAAGQDATQPATPANQNGGDQSNGQSQGTMQQNAPKPNAVERTTLAPTKANTPGGVKMAIVKEIHDE